MNLWQLNQGAMVPTQQKAMVSPSSAPRWLCRCCQCQAAGCALLSGQHWASSSEHRSGSRSATSLITKLSINNLIDIYSSQNDVILFRTEAWIPCFLQEKKKIQCYEPNLSNNVQGSIYKGQSDIHTKP